VNIYAVSIPGVTPSRFITWFQAAAAARNAGKRLPSNAEWQATGAGDAGSGRGAGRPGLQYQQCRTEPDRRPGELRLGRGSVRHGREHLRVGGRLGAADHVVVLNRVVRHGRCQLPVTGGSLDSADMERSDLPVPCRSGGPRPRSTPLAAPNRRQGLPSPASAGWGRLPSRRSSSPTVTPQMLLLWSRQSRNTALFVGYLLPRTLGAFPR
jgi:hypothetical protein